jgi:hypothetical protein
MENQHSSPTSQLDSNTILVILLLIFAFPIGIVLMWILMKHWPKWMRWVITAPMIIIPIIYILLFSVVLFAIRPSEQIQKAEETQQKSEQIKNYYNTQLSLTPAATDAVIPAGWTYHTSNECAVALPVPPKKTPYYIPPSGSEPANIDEGRYWMFEESSAFTENSIFTYSARVLFGNPNGLGSGYVPGMVLLQCASNKDNYTSQTLATESVRRYNSSSAQGDFTAQITGTKVFSDKNFTEVTYTGGMIDGMKSYYLVENNMIYELQVTHMSTNPFIVSTTDRIANLIKFN